MREIVCRSTAALFALCWLGFCCVSDATALSPKLDRSGKTLVLATPAAAKIYSTSIASLRQLHAGCSGKVAQFTDRTGTLKLLRKERPRYVIWFITPSELELKGVWRWLETSSRVDSDPFVDVRTGFFTGSTPASVERFVERTIKAATGKLMVPDRLLDNLGPNMRLPKSGFTEFSGSWFLSGLLPVLKGKTISHGSGGYPDSKLEEFHGAGIIHLGGHGYPDGIVNGLEHTQLRSVNLAHSVVFNGACYTGVAGRWYDFRNTVGVKQVKPENSFCLAMLDNNVIAYFAAVSADHGIPVYQEMENAFVSGGTTGDIIKSTQDGLTIARNGKQWTIPELSNNGPRPVWTPGDFMMYGTASRILFGDPSLQVFKKSIGAPFDIDTRSDASGRLIVVARVKNASLRSSFTNTYACDLSAVKNLFNDRVYLKLPVQNLPVKNLRGEIVACSMTTNGRQARVKPVGCLIETDGGRRFLHVQVDVETSAYMKGPLRTAGAEVILTVE